jgi:hypothetical protein
VRTDFSFTKTRGYPYELVVCAVLAAAADRAPDAISVSSDGDPPDWAKPVEWACSVLGREIRSPIDDEA